MTMTSPPADPAAWLDGITLAYGSHAATDHEWCVMEAVAYVAGEPHSDHPQCASPVLTDFAISLNDQLDEAQRQMLRPFVPRLVGTRDDGLDETRSYLALDWLIRTYTPAWLDLAGLSTEAVQLRALDRIVDLPAAESAGPAVRQAQQKAAAAGDAAWDAAWAAARDAAGDAAWDATGDATGDAAAAAAAAATAAAVVVRAATTTATAATAAAVVRDAAAAARAALRPTVEQLQASALDLLDRMIDGRWDA